MKLPCYPVVALLGALVSVGHAFTLDAAGYEGGDLAKDPFSVLVPGYGEVVFESDLGAPLVVDSAYGNGKGFEGTSLRFNPLDVVKISSQVQSGVRMASNGDAILSSQDFPMVDQAAGDGRGPRVNVWNAIPEPATAGLGLVGIAALLLGRRR